MDASPNQNPTKPQQFLDLDAATAEIARRYGVPDRVWRRMINQESGGNDKAVSPKGARTAWQIMDATARGLGYTPEEIRDEPLKAAEGGLRILRDNYKRFRQHAQNEKHAWMMAVAGYHTNPDNVERDLKRGGMGLPLTSDGLITTRDHVLKIFDGIRGEEIDRAPQSKRTNNNFSVNGINARAQRIPSNRNITSRAVNISNVSPDTDSERFPPTESETHPARRTGAETVTNPAPEFTPEAVPVLGQTQTFPSKALTFAEQGIDERTGKRILPPAPTSAPQSKRAQSGTVDVSFPGEFAIAEPAPSTTSGKPTVARADLESAGYIQRPLVDARNVPREQLEEHLFREGLRQIAPGFNISDADIEAEITDRRRRGKSLIDLTGIDEVLRESREKYKDYKVPVALDGATIKNILDRRLEQEARAELERRPVSESNEQRAERAAQNVFNRLFGYERRAAPSSTELIEKQIREEGGGRARGVLDREQRLREMESQEIFPYEERLRNAGAAFTKAPLRAGAALLESSAILESALQRVGAPSLGTAIDNVRALLSSETGGQYSPGGAAASERWQYAVSGAFKEWLDRQLPSNPDLQNHFIFQQMPDTLGQLAGTIFAGAATGGAALPTILGASQGAAELYEDAKKHGAAEEARIFAAGVGAVLAAPDALLFNKWFKALPEQAKKTVIERVLSGMKDAGFEAAQESVEKTGGDLTARALYDADREVKPLNFREAALGGLAGTAGSLTTQSPEILVGEQSEMETVGGRAAIERPLHEERQQIKAQNAIQPKIEPGELRETGLPSDETANPTRAIKVGIFYAAGKTPPKLGKGDMIVRLPRRAGTIVLNRQRALDDFGIRNEQDVRAFVAQNGIAPLIGDDPLPTLTEQTATNSGEDIESRTEFEFTSAREAFDYFQRHVGIDERATAESLRLEKPQIVLANGERVEMANAANYAAGREVKARFVKIAASDFSQSAPNRDVSPTKPQAESNNERKAKPPALIAGNGKIKLTINGVVVREFSDNTAGRKRAERQLEQARIAFEHEKQQQQPIEGAEDADEIRFLNRNADSIQNFAAQNRRARLMPRARVEKIASESGLSRLAPVRVVQSESELPQAVQNKIAAQNASGQITGVYHGEDLYLVADNIRDGREAVKTAAHEIVGHSGLRALVGTRLDRVLDQISKDFGTNSSYQKIASDYGLDLSTVEGRRETAEEFIAHRAEDVEFQNSSVYQRLRAVVRAALREISAKVFGENNAFAWNDADVDELLKKAFRNLEKRADERAQTDSSTTGAPAPTETDQPTDTRFARTPEAKQNETAGPDAPERDSVLQTVTNLRRAGLVSSFRTHARNIAGNAAFQASEEAARGFAYFADRLVSPVTGERTVSFIDPRAVAKSFTAVFKKDGRLTSAASKESGIRQAFNIIRYGDSAANLEKAQLSEPNSGSRIIDAWVKLNFRALSAEDALFKAYGFRRSLEEQAKTISQTEAKKNKSVDRRAVIKNLLDNPTPEMIAQASLDADFLTFQNDNKISSGIERLKDANEYGRFLIEQIAPFDRTPTNVVLRALDYTPAGYARAIFGNLPNIVEGVKKTDFGREMAQARFSDGAAENQTRRGLRFDERLKQSRRREDLRLQSELEAVFKKLEETADQLDLLLKKASVTNGDNRRLAHLERTIEDLQNRYFDLRARADVKAKQRKFNDLEIERRRALVDDALLRFFTRSEQREFAMNIGRAGVGTGLMALGYALAANGYLAGIWDYEEERGRGKKQPDDRAAKHRRDEFFWRKTHGIENGSLLIPNFGRVVILDSPGGKVLTLGATLFEQTQHAALYADKKQKSAFDAWEKSAETSARIAKTLAAEQPLLKSTTELFDESENGTWKDRAAQTAGNYLGSFVPSIAADAGEVMDDRPRKTRGFKNAVLRRIPIARRAAEESKVRVPTAERGGAMRKILRAVDPFNTRQVMMRPYIYGAPKTPIPADLEDILEDIDRKN
jgi:hypothetical protein